MFLNIFYIFFKITFFDYTQNSLTFLSNCGILFEGEKNEKEKTNHKRNDNW